jgi:hypothetical protein
MSIRCGGCQGRHDTVDQVRACCLGRQEKVDDGFYLHDGAAVRVNFNRAGTRRYASVLVIVAYDDGSQRGRWEYTAGLYGQLRADELMTPEKAKEFGDLYGVCFKCGAALTNPESIERGCGPICADKMGW